MNPIRSIAPKTDHQLYWALALAIMAVILAGADALAAGAVFIVLGLAFFATWRHSRGRHDDGGLTA